MEYTKYREQKIGKKTTEKVIALKKKKGKITVDDVVLVKKQMIEDGVKQFGKNNFKMPLIKVLAGKWVTFTSEKEFNDYFEDNVKDPSKFYEFTDVHIYVNYQE